MLHAAGFPGEVIPDRVCELAPCDPVGRARLDRQQPARELGALALRAAFEIGEAARDAVFDDLRSEEHTSESSHVEISYAVFCLKKKKKHKDVMTSHHN